MRRPTPWTSMSALTLALESLNHSRPRPSICNTCLCRARVSRSSMPSRVRTFTNTAPSQSWLVPRSPKSGKDLKGRPRVPTGGSKRGTTVIWGQYGLRLLDHDRRISAAQLRNGEEAIKKRLRGLKYRLYTRISADIGVYTSGNETRMGKGKGSFDHWASRVAVSKIIFELTGEVHEQIIRDAFRLAGNKLPGKYEFVMRGDPPVMGLAKVATPEVEKALRRPRLEALTQPNLMDTAGRLGAGKNPVPAVDPAATTAGTTQMTQTSS